MSHGQFNLILLSLLIFFLEKTSKGSFYISTPLHELGTELPSHLTRALAQRLLWMVP